MYARLPQKWMPRNPSYIKIRLPDSTVLGMTLERTVFCAWCNAEMRIAAPNVGRDGYFFLPRQCRECAGNNIVELSGSVAEVRQLRRGRRHSAVTQKIHAPRVGLFSR